MCHCSVPDVDIEWGPSQCRKLPSRHLCRTTLLIVHRGLIVYGHSEFVKTLARRLSKHLQNEVLATATVGTPPEFRAIAYQSFTERDGPAS
jgi:hypothetical protein